MPFKIVVLAAVIFLSSSAQSVILTRYTKTDVSPNGPQNDRSQAMWKWTSEKFNQKILIETQQLADAYDFDDGLVMVFLKPASGSRVRWGALTSGQGVSSHCGITIREYSRTYEGGVKIAQATDSSHITGGPLDWQTSTSDPALILFRAKKEKTYEFFQYGNDSRCKGVVMQMGE